VPPLSAYHHIFDHARLRCSTTDIIRLRPSSECKMAVTNWRPVLVVTPLARSSGVKQTGRGSTWIVDCPTNTGQRSTSRREVGTLPSAGGLKRCCRVVVCHLQAAICAANVGQRCRHWAVMARKPRPQWARGWMVHTLTPRATSLKVVPSSEHGCHRHLWAVTGHRYIGHYINVNFNFITKRKCTEITIERREMTVLRPSRVMARKRWDRVAIYFR